MTPLLPQFLDKTATPTLDDGLILVWSGGLELEKSALHLCASVLSQDEMGRAKRFKFETDRDHFTAARGILRFLLGVYTQIAPADLAFAYGEKGKPELRTQLGELQFNVSHSHGVGVWALGLNRMVGVDLEYTQRTVDLDRVAKRFFSENEWAELANLSEEDRRQGFFRCWTRKEAFVKALGDGLSFSLKAFDVSVGQTAEITRIEGDQDPEQWTMDAFEPAVGYVGALAVEGQAKVTYQKLACK